MKRYDCPYCHMMWFTITELQWHIQRRHLREDPSNVRRDAAQLNW